MIEKRNGKIIKTMTIHIEDLVRCELCLDKLSFKKEDFQDHVTELHNDYKMKMENLKTEKHELVEAIQEVAQHLLSIKQNPPGFTPQITELFQNELQTLNEEMFAKEQQIFELEKEMGSSLREDLPRSDSGIEFKNEETLVQRISLLEGTLSHLKVKSSNENAVEQPKVQSEMRDVDSNTSCPEFVIQNVCSGKEIADLKHKQQVLIEKLRIATSYLATFSDVKKENAILRKENELTSHRMTNAESERRDLIKCLMVSMVTNGHEKCQNEIKLLREELNDYKFINKKVKHCVSNETQQHISLELQKCIQENKDLRESFKHQESETRRSYENEIGNLRAKLEEKDSNNEHIREQLANQNMTLGDQYKALQEYLQKVLDETFRNKQILIESAEQMRQQNILVQKLKEEIRVAEQNKLSIQKDFKSATEKLYRERDALDNTVARLNKRIEVLKSERNREQGVLNEKVLNDVNTTQKYKEKNAQLLEDIQNVNNENTKLQDEIRRLSQQVNDSK